MSRNSKEDFVGHTANAEQWRPVSTTPAPGQKHNKNTFTTTALIEDDHHSSAAKEATLLGAEHAPALSLS